MRTLLAIIVALALATGDAGSATPATTAKKSRARRIPAPVTMVWHVETQAGGEITSLDGDLPINPASVVKVATSLMALERLGPDHRFDTFFETAGEIDVPKGILRGDLIVSGGGDPDFHVENVFLVSARLNALGIRTLTGSVRVDERFWIGWEGGSERVLKDREARAVMMAGRIRAALDPKRWNRSTLRAWNEFAARYSLPATKPPKVSVLGGTGLARSRGDDVRTLLIHRSKPLVETLRRFDAFSNNDIERLADTLGPPESVARELAAMLGAPEGAVQLATISGLGSNRMSPKLVVRLLHQLRETCARLGLSIEAVLPVAGCDPGTLNHSFARLCTGPNRMSMVAKTGTLTYTDGGAAVLAGFINTGQGDFAFCIAAPGAAGRLETARRQQAQWIEQLIAVSDGPRPRTCAAPMGRPEGDARIVMPPDIAASNAGAGAR